MVSPTLNYHTGHRTDAKPDHAVQYYVRYPKSLLPYEVHYRVIFKYTISNILIVWWKYTVRMASKNVLEIGSRDFRNTFDKSLILSTLQGIPISKEHR